MKINGGAAAKSMSIEKTKADLIIKLQCLKNNFFLGLGAAALFTNPKVHPFLEGKKALFKVENVLYQFEYKQLIEQLTEGPLRNIMIQEFLKSHVRTLLKEGFQIIQTYCKDTSQDSKMKAEPWYDFARIIRNSLTHNYRLDFNKHDKMLLPLTWKNRTIDSTMDGSFLKMEFFFAGEAWEMFKEFQNFTFDKLN